MKLTIAVVASEIILRWTTPEAGSWALLSRDPQRWHEWRVEAAGSERGACHLAVKVKRGNDGRVYWTVFQAVNKR